MSVADLKARLADVPGIETLTMQMLGGRMVFGFAGMIAAVDPLATDQDIEDAIRVAADRKAEFLARSNSTPLPDVGLMPAQATETKPMSTGASHAGLSLKQMMEAHKTRVAKMLEDNLAKVQAGFDKQVQGANAIGKLGDKVNAEGDDLLATVGEFTNDLGLD